MKKKFFVIVLMIVTSLLSSCFLFQKEQTVDLSVFENLSTSTQWCIITDPYASFFSEPSKTSAITTHGRKSDILNVIGKKIILNEDKKELWYEFDKGWLESSSIRVFSNKLQAQQESKKALK